MVGTQATIIGSRTDSDGYHYIADVTEQGAIVISGVVSINGFVGSITIGSVSANVDLGSVYIIEDEPTSTNHNNPAWAFNYTGDVISSVVQFIGAGSYVQDLTYNIGSSITNVGSWY